MRKSRREGVDILDGMHKEMGLCKEKRGLYTLRCTFLSRIEVEIVVNLIV